MSGRSHKKPRRKRVDLTIKRVRAVITLLDKLGHGLKSYESRVLLHDISAEGLGIFCESPLPTGHLVEVTFENPHLVRFRGKIAWSEEFGRGSRVFSASQFKNRAGIQLVFKDQADKDAMKKIFEAFTKEILFGIPAINLADPGPALPLPAAAAVTPASAPAHATPTNTSPAAEALPSQSPELKENLTPDTGSKDPTGSSDPQAA